MTARPPAARRAVDGRALAAEAAVVVGLVFGWFILLSLVATAAGFPVGARYSNAAVIGVTAGQVAFAALALRFLARRGHAPRELLPRPTLLGTAMGIALCLLFWLLWPLLANALSLGRFVTGPVEPLVAGARPHLYVLVLFACFNALYEETFLLGYLARAFERSGALFAIGLAMLVRILYHLYQGPIGAVSVLLFGLLVTVFYWRTRLLWPAVVAHAASDLAALT
jgi:membrane protease YdiL (CAAX protease family)